VINEETILCYAFAWSAPTTQRKRKVISYVVVIKKEREIIKEKERK